ncbi:aspartic proteinase-like protein 2 [Cynara cardunculus var. scolymus]|uniref:aspartic proteinase-like protein 2 n=1 Tax=Cynara cardunculus var. scolymus TaxID=59895 RepID=UPI000D62C01E|nr:aspartic proteinase-like protein 2 [Cynara cardunculus var. scolymus]
MDLNKQGFVVVLLHLCMLASANVVFQVQHKFAGNKRSLTELKAHDSVRHGRILSAVDIPIGGDSSPTLAALYFTKIRIGTPPKDYHVQVDTGSDLLWVNCVGCQKCPKKSDLGISLALYNPKASSSAKIVTCDQQICRSTHNAAISNCKVGKQCSYSVTYGDGSSATGYFVKDIVQVDRVSGDHQTTSMNGNIAFGCGSQKSGDMGSSQAALDGILGFGQANSSMLSQLASAKKVKKIFSHCLDGSKGGGIFAIGEVVQPKVKTTPMIPDQEHYNVEMKAIEVGGQVLRLPSGIFGPSGKRGIIIDSGTTLAYLPDLAYKQVMEKIKVAQPKIKSHIVDQQFTCYKYSGNVDKGFPVVTFHFANSLSLKVYPHQYLFEVEDHEWCVGFQDSNLQTKDGKDLTLLGDLVLTDKVVTYDMEKKTIGWIEHNCSSSIKVKDDESGKLYSVSSHNISPAGRINASTGIIVACFMTLMVATFIKQRLD